MTAMKALSDRRTHVGTKGGHRLRVYSNLFYVDDPTGSTKSVSHIEGDSPRVTGLNLDQWTSRSQTYSQGSLQSLFYITI